MSRFLSELDCHLKNDKIWVLNKHLFYYSDILKKIIRVPEGFETDLSSVPRVPFVFWFWGERAHREGVLHDYLYRQDSVPLVTQDIADRIFKEAMKSRRKSIFVRWPMYLGVCIGGWCSYHKKKVFDKL